MPKTKEPKEKKPKKTKKVKKPESESEDDISEEMATLEVEEKPKKHKPKKEVSFREESPDEEEEEQLCHACGQCGKEFDCHTGKFSKDGKRFNCRCPKERDGKDTYYFCSEECLQGTDDIEEETNADEDDTGEGWDEV